MRSSSYGGPSHRVELLVLVLAAVVAALAVRSQMSRQEVPPWLLPVDDAYIFIRYAEQAAEGRPLQWNVGERSTGATDPAFTLLLIPGQWLFDDLAGWSYWSSFVGLLSLAGLGLAATSLTRALRPNAGWWPLAAGLAVIGGGPFAYFSVGGMDNAFAGAMLLGALARFVSSDGRRGRIWISCLPWVRPDYAVVVGVTGLWTLVHDAGSRMRRLGSFTALFVPGLVLMTLNHMATGHASPGGALAKSVFSEPFQTAGKASAAVARQFLEQILPVYVGLRPTVLPPPVGLLTVLVVVWVIGHTVRASSRRDVRRLMLPAWIWLALAAVATTSGFLWWQRLRHHHPGLALAWILAFAGLSSWAMGRRVRRPHLLAGPLVVVLGLTPWIGLAEVSSDYAASARSFFTWNFRPAAWLQEHLRDADPMPVVAMHDAGLLSLAATPLDREVAQVDLMGLGTTELALPYRDGIGAVVEQLARRSPLPTLAVGRRALLRLGPILGTELFSSPPGVSNATVVAPIDGRRLHGTALATPGVDFAHLASERQVGLRWNPPPPSGGASVGVVVPQTGTAVVQGCRPLLGRLDLELYDLAELGSRYVLTFAAIGSAAGEPFARLKVSADGQTQTADAYGSKVGRLTLPATTRLRLERIEPPAGVPCVESLSVTD